MYHSTAGMRIMSNGCLLLYGESGALSALKLHRVILTLLREDQLGDALKALRIHIEEVCEQTIDEFQKAMNEMGQ